MRRLALLGCLLCLSPLSFADDVKKVLADMKTAYKAIQSANLKLELSSPEDSDDSQAVIKFDYNFAAPNKERMTIVPPGDEDGITFISEANKVVWSSKPMPDDEKDSDDKDDD